MNNQLHLGATQLLAVTGLLAMLASPTAAAPQSPATIASPSRSPEQRGGSSSAPEGIALETAASASGPSRECRHGA